MAQQYYIWITDYNKNKDVVVNTRDGEVRIESPTQVIKMDADTNTLFVNAARDKDEFTSQTALSYVIKQYQLDKIDESKTFWSISPYATQKEMVDSMSEYTGKSEVQVQTGTTH